MTTKLINSGAALAAFIAFGAASCGGDDSGGCPAGMQTCGGTCVDLSTDHDNCGGCGNDCGAAICSAGRCNCTGGMTLCGTTCANLQADTSNCGSCGNSCPAGQFCRAATCTADCTPVDESCNGQDDDCDGSTDETLTRDCNTTCGAGTQSCTMGSWGTCSAPTPTTEVCDGVDNDCDGSTDEGVGTTYYRDADSDLYGTPLDTRVACGTPPSGYVANDDDCDDTTDAVSPGDPENCANTIDDDCDGSTDNGCSCAPTGGTEACGHSGTGTCVMGTRTCTASGWGPCTGATMPATESCDALDNDCDGSTDEGLPPDASEANDTCAQARPLGTAYEGFPGDPPTAFADATLLKSDGSADVDWFTISAVEATHLDCGLPWELLPQCYFYLEIALAPPAGVDHTAWRMCVYGGSSCSDLGTEYCTDAADWDATAGAYGMALTWEGTCYLDDSWNFHVKVDSTSAAASSCAPYELSYGFYFDGGAGDSYCI